MKLRRTKPPADVLALVPGDERLLGWGRCVDGPVAATGAALHTPGLGRVPWEKVHRASWDEPVLELVVDGRIHRVVLEEGGAVPGVVHDRVTATVLVQHFLALDGDRGARLVARRVPGSDSVSWRVIFDPGLDPQDPELRERAAAGLRELRIATGL